MTFKEWLFSTYPNPKINGEWGPLHITVLVLAIAFIVASSIFFKKASYKTKFSTLCVMAGILIFFGLTRRVIGFIKMSDWTLNKVLYTLLRFKAIETGKSRSLFFAGMVNRKSGAFSSCSTLCKQRRRSRR